MQPHSPHRRVEDDEREGDTQGWGTPPPARYSTGYRPPRREADDVSVDDEQAHDDHDRDADDEDQSGQKVIDHGGSTRGDDARQWQSTK